jgi:hypothetical protein
MKKKFDLFGIQTHPIPLNTHGLRANRTSPQQAHPTPPPSRAIPTPHAEPAQPVGMCQHVGPPAHRLSRSPFLGRVGPCCQLGLLHRSSPDHGAHVVWNSELFIVGAYSGYIPDLWRVFPLDYLSERPGNHHLCVCHTVRRETRGRKVPSPVIFTHIGESLLGLWLGASPICMGALPKSLDSVC